MNDRIKLLSEHVGNTLPKLIVEAEESILESIDVAREYVEEGKPLVVSIPISIKWDTDSNKIEISLAVNTKRKWVSEASLEDPNQPSLIDRDGNPLPENIAKGVRGARAVREDGGEE